VIVGVLLAAMQIATTQPSTPLREAEPGSNLTVYLLTMGPGDQVWEKFGHNAIWIHDAAAGTDIAYNWGLFDFADADFIPRFIQGRMRYSMGGFDLEQTIDAYRQANRTVWAQELNLTSAQKQKLAEFVAWNVLPENRYYDYDYYRDNCSTRVRDALDNALGGIIESASSTVPSGTTYRFHTSRLTQDDIAIFTGTMTGLGQPVDEPISRYEEMFLPVRMKERLKEIRVQTPAGSQPLVTSERVLFEATRPPEETTVNTGIAMYAAAAAVILLLGASLILLRRPTHGGAGAIGVAGLWSFVAGLAGTLIAFLWGFTDHLYSYRNENLLQLNPLSLILTVFLIRFAWKRWQGALLNAEGARRAALRVAIVVAALSVIGFVIQVLPGFDQVNGYIIALALPLHAGIVAMLVALDPGPVDAGAR
jgi:uncharacterized membrane protein